MRRLHLIETSDEAQGALKIAFATQDLHRVDSHFGSAPAIVIYEVGPSDYRFVEAVQFDQVSNQNGVHIDEPESDDRIGAKVAALTGCAMVFSLAIGGGGGARGAHKKAHPLQLPAPQAHPHANRPGPTRLNRTPPPWLRKLLGQPTAAFLDE
jgi:nitrogen fixation protein NifX